MRHLCAAKSAGEIKFGKNQIQESMPHWEAHLLKVPRGTDTWETLRILELPGLGFVVPLIDGSP